jgi:hypothetical protein
MASNGSTDSIAVARNSESVVYYAPVIPIAPNERHLRHTGACVAKVGRLQQQQAGPMLVSVCVVRRGGYCCVPLPSRPAALDQAC